VLITDCGGAINVDWKFRILVNLVRTPPRESGNCYYFRTVSHPEFSLLRQLFYVNGRKTVPIELLLEQFTEFSLAVWLMDDGTVDGWQLRLNTQSFSKDESGALASVLRAKLGVDTSLNRDKDRYRLRITASSMARFRSLVQGYVIPSMLYKLPL
jgi:hypothetical protein